MSKFISSDTEINQALIFNNDNFSLDKLVDHLVRIGRFLCCRGRLYFYNSDKGIFIPLPENEIWFCICRYISRGATELFEPKDIRKLISKLKFNLDLHFDSDKFDTYDDLINVNNGVFNVTTGELIPKKREYYFTSNIDAAFLEDVSLDDCPAFRKFYETSLCGDEKSLILLLQIIGYLCCNYSCAKKAFMFIGEKNCGKSKILEFITRLIGENNVCNIPLHKLGNRFNVAELSRNKVNIQAELSLEPLREIETFKNAVGGDTLAIKELLKLIQNGYRFEMPVLSQARIQSFMEQNNQIHDFLSEYCVFGSEYKVFSRDLYHAYEKFCKDNCLFAHNQTAFLDAVSMREGVIRNRVRINGERYRGFEGIGLNMQDSHVSCNNFTDTKTDVPSVPERSELF